MAKYQFWGTLRGKSGNTVDHEALKDPYIAALIA